MLNVFSNANNKNSLNFSATSRVDGLGLVSEIHEANLIKLLFGRLFPDNSFKRVNVCLESPKQLSNIFL